MTQTRSYFKYLKQLMIEQLKDAHYGARNKYNDDIDVSNIFWAVRWQRMGYHFIPKWIYIYAKLCESFEIFAEKYSV